MNEYSQAEKICNFCWWPLLTMGLEGKRPKGSNTNHFNISIICCYRKAINMQTNKTSQNNLHTDFKLAVLTYRCLHGLAPRYLSNYIQSVAVSNHHRLRSSSSSQLVIRRTRLSTVGDHAFPVAGSRLWKSAARRHLSFNAGCFSKPPQNFSFPDHFLPNCFQLLVLHTVYSSGLAVFVL